MNVEYTGIKLEKKYKYDSGIDLFADETVRIFKGKVQVVKLSARMHFPEPSRIQRFFLKLLGIPVVSYAGELRMKSGESRFILMGGVVDAPYRGVIYAKIYAIAENDFVISEGDKVCQLLIKPVFDISFVNVKNIDSKTDRGEDGGVVRELEVKNGK